MKKFNPSYISKKNDIVRHVPNNSKYILDIGCSIETIGKQIKKIGIR